MSGFGTKSQNRARIDYSVVLKGKERPQEAVGESKKHVNLGKDWLGD